MIYHVQYQRCLTAGIISLFLLFLSVSVTLAEEVSVINTSDFPGSVQLVTKGANGKAVYGHYSFKCCDMSDDGSFVFKSDATNLVMPTTSNTYRIYFYDNPTKRVLLLPEFGNDRLDGVKITDDKKWIMIQTFDYITKIDKAFLYNISTTELIPMVKTDGTTLLVGGLDVTADDRVVAFSTPTRLDPADTNSKSDLYLWNRDTKAIQLISTIANSSSAAGIEGPWRISADDTFVAYIGVGNNFPNCGTRTYDIYRKNIATGYIVCVTEEIPENDQEYFNSFQMSADGNVFVFTAIVTEEVNPRSTSLYLIDLVKGTTPTVLFNREEYNTINHLKLTKDGKNVVYSKELYGKTNELCTYNIQTATHTCIARPTVVRDGDLWLTSPTGRYSLISSWDHMWVGSIVENKNSNGYYDNLFLWDREGMNNAISGKATGDDGITGLENVIMTNGTRERYITDANGHFTMPYLNVGQSYEITPSLSGKTFYPANKLATVPNGSVDFSTKSPVQSVVVFIPGITGSNLRRTSDNGFLWPVWFDEPKLGLSLKPTLTPIGVYTDDVFKKYSIRFLPDYLVYEPFLNKMHDLSFVEYKTGGNPDRRRLGENNCDTTQKNATLFVFPYDWRYGIADGENPQIALSPNNVALLHEFIQCILLIYQGQDVEVTVVAHSMGGMLTTQYLLTYPNPTDHHLKRVISVGTPYLGAPKAIAALLAGEFAPEIISPRTTKVLLEYFPGAHQLLPSKRYFELTDSPLVTYNQNLSLGGTGNASFTPVKYENFQAVLKYKYRSPDENATYPTTVDFVANNEVVFSMQAFTDWSQETFGVEYHILYGEARIPWTIGQVKDKVIFHNDNSIGEGTIVYEGEYVYERVPGDDTVPVVSASRIGKNGENLNGGAHPYRFKQQKGEAYIEHMKLLRNQRIQNCVFFILGKSTTPCANDQESVSASNVQEMNDFRYINLWGVTSLRITDGISTTDELITSTLSLESLFPDVKMQFMGDTAVSIILPEDAAYTVYIASDKYLQVEAEVGNGVTANQFIRFVDMPVEVGSRLNINSTPTNPIEMWIDINADRIPDTLVQPTGALSGSEVADTTPPTVTIAIDTQQQTANISANDDLSGVSRIFYSFDGTSYFLYTQTAKLPTDTMNIYARAEDKMGNVSVVVTKQLEIKQKHYLFLPVVQH